MKRKLKTLTGTAVISVLTFSTFTADSLDRPADRPEAGRDRPIGVRRDVHLTGAAAANDVIGMTVKNYQDEKIGKVEDLAVDVESGRLVQVVLATGGFAGVGTTLVAVPPAALRHDVAQKILRLDADKARLAGAPKYDDANWDANTQSNRVREIYGYYGERPYFVANPDWSKTANSEEAKSASEDLKLVRALPRRMDGTINTDGRSATEKARNTEAVRHVAQYYNTITIRNPDGSLTREYYPSENETNLSGSHLGYVQKGSKLIGTPVKNLQEEKLGKVENIIVDLPSGRILALIVSSGGFLGIGDELSAIPSTAFHLTTDRESLQLDASKERLSNAPHFKPNQWPNFEDPAYAGGLYRAYKVEPYFTTDTTVDVNGRTRATGTVDVDNTGRNVRDRNDRTLTPPDQGTSKSDVATTADIRKQILWKKNLSVNAKNVKIVTVNGRVTLRGPVDSDEEKSTIGAIANQVAQPGNVDNQLEVKAAADSKN